MDTIALFEQGKALFRKYRYGLLVLLAGLALMAVPEKEEPAAVTPSASQPAKTTVGEELEAILSRIQGAGKVQVLLTEYKGQEILYQTDTDRSETSLRQDTVILSGTDREEGGLIRQTNPPVYLGALIVCQGGDNPRVKLAIVEAVMSVTGLKSTEITVLKMK